MASMADPNKRLSEDEDLPRTDVKKGFYVPPETTLVGPHTTYESLTPYQKKSILINKELDIMGMGRYQWCIFFLCGCGYFLDLCWAQVFGLVAARLQQEFGVAPGRIGYIFTAFSVGLTVGAAFWGICVDVFGRRWCFNLTCLIASIFGMLCAAPDGFVGVCVFVSFVGFGVGGNIPIDSTITLEFLPTNRRWLLAALSTFQPIGVVVATVLAYGLVPKYSCATGLPPCATGAVPCCQKGDNMGWRYVLITIGCLTLGIFILRFFVFTFEESPKYLLSRGMEQEAIDVVHRVARFNRRPEPALALDDFRAIDAETESTTSTSSNVIAEDKPLHTSRWQAFKYSFVVHASRLKALRGMVDTKVMAWLTACLFVAYISLFWAFTIAGGYLPIILADKGVDLEVSLDETQYVYIYLPGILGTLAAAALMETGRRWGMVIASAGMAVTLFCYPQANSIAGNVGLNAAEYVLQSMYAALLYAFTPEAFPAPYRGSACGLLSTCGRLSGIVAPTAAASVYAAGSNGVLYLAGGGSLLSTLAVALVPFDTKGKQTY